MMMVNPVAANLENSDLAAWAIRSPAPTMRRKATTTMVEPRRPISSPIPAKMKSVLTLGISHGDPSPRPVPPIPPLPIEYHAWRSWPPGSDGEITFHGSGHVSIRMWVWARYVAQTHIRIETWVDAWKVISPSDPGGQLRQAWYSMGSGGIGGTGLGLGSPWLIPNVRTDFIFAGIGEEMGLLGSTMVVVAFLLIVGAGLRIAQAAKSEFSKLAATGLTIIIGFQAFFIIGGVVRLLPLTGITLPFVSYGGSALIANYILI